MQDRRRKWTWRHDFKSWTRLIAFHIALIPLGKIWIQLFSLHLWVNSRADWFFSLDEATSLGEGKLWIQTCKTCKKCPSWSNSLWQGWSCWLVHCPGENDTVPILRVLASSLGISSWTPLKPQHSNPNPNPLVNQLWCIDFFIPPTPLNIPHRLPDFLEFLMPLKNWCLIHARCS